MLLQPVDDSEVALPNTGPDELHALQNMCMRLFAAERSGAPPLYAPAGKFEYVPLFSSSCWKKTWQRSAGPSPSSGLRCCRAVTSKCARLSAAFRGAAKPARSLDPCGSTRAQVFHPF